LVLIFIESYNSSCKICFIIFCKGSVAVTLYAKNSTHVVRSERQVKVVTMLNVRYLVFYGHTLEDAPCCKALSQRRDA
jgi:hypothetical protein